MQETLFRKIDWVTVLVYGVLVFVGWTGIYATEYDPDSSRGIFDPDTKAGVQFIWICAAIIIARVIFLLDYTFFDRFAYLIYGILIAGLVSILFVGKEVAGSKSWVGLGGLGFQPSEFAKMGTAFALAKFLNHPLRNVSNVKPLIIGLSLILLPLVLIVLQGDTGTAMVYGVFIVALFREGMSPALLILVSVAALVFLLTLFVDQVWLLVTVTVLVVLAVGLNAKKPKRIARIIIAGILIMGAVGSVDFIISDVLKPYQQKRLMSLVNPNIDRYGAGWNVTQSKIAIGSGGFLGKGFLEGTQTKFDFVPEQTTDFIFCTIGEEHGWIGSLFTVTVFAFLLLRLVMLAERQKSVFSRVFGYCTMGILAFHFSVNIAMTIGLFPVIGIPLPFFSYGGSSLWSFTLLLFCFLKMDAQRKQVLQRG